MDIESSGRAQAAPEPGIMASALPSQTCCLGLGRAIAAVSTQRCARQFVICCSSRLLLVKPVGSCLCFSETRISFYGSLHSGKARGLFSPVRPGPERLDPSESRVQGAGIRSPASNKQLSLIRVERRQIFQPKGAACSELSRNCSSA